MYSFKASFLVGRFKPDERFMYNFSLGLGVHYRKQGQFVDSTNEYIPIDSAWFTNVFRFEPQTEISGLVSIGASISYRLIKGFGICAEAEYDMLTGMHHNYFPVRGGLFYMF